MPKRAMNRHRGGNPETADGFREGALRNIDLPTGQTALNRSVAIRYRTQAVLALP